MLNAFALMAFPHCHCDCALPTTALSAGSSHPDRLTRPGWHGWATNGQTSQRHCWGKMFPRMAPRGMRENRKQSATRGQPLTEFHLGKDGRPRFCPSSTSSLQVRVWLDFSLFLGIGGGGSGGQSVFSLTFHENPIRDCTRTTSVEKGKNVPKVKQLGGSLGVASPQCSLPHLADTHKLGGMCVGTLSSLLVSRDGQGTPEHNFRRRCPSSAPLYSQVPLTGPP